MKNVTRKVMSQRKENAFKEIMAEALRAELKRKKMPRDSVTLMTLAAIGCQLLDFGVALDPHQLVAVLTASRKK